MLLCGIRLNLGLLGKKLTLPTIFHRIEGVNPFSSAVAGEAFANRWGSLKFLFTSFIVVFSFIFFSRFHSILLENPKILV